MCEIIRLLYTLTMGCMMPKEKEVRPNVQSIHTRPLPPSSTDIRFKYDFVKAIGRGHFGTVYLACLKTQPMQLVAVKSMIKKKVQGVQERLEREIRILFSLDHPNIIRLYEVFEDAKYVHLVTEYCSGGELFEHIVAMGRYSEPDAVGLLRKILLAVNNLHHNNVCHRDLKPENFMFEDNTETAELKLIDFGLSNKFRNDDLSSFVGTPEYVAPEVIQGGYGSKCDLWSVGVIMYAMLSGKMPFTGAHISDTFARIIQGEFKVNTDEFSLVSPQAIDLLRKLLVVDPESRLSADEALTHPWFVQSFPDVLLPITKEVIDSLRNYRVKSKFQSEAYAIIVKCLNVSQIRDMKETFMALDREKNGFLSFQEVEQGLLAAGYQIAAHEIEEILGNADFKKDGRINYSEFLAATLESRALLDDDVIWSVFNRFDVDSTGVITEANLKEALQRAGRQVSQSNIHDMMAEVGAEEQGLNYEAFKKLVKHDN